MTLVATAAAPHAVDIRARALGVRHKGGADHRIHAAGRGLAAVRRHVRRHDQARIIMRIIAMII